MGHIDYLKYSYIFLQRKLKHLLLIIGNFTKIAILYAWYCKTNLLLLLNTLQSMIHIGEPSHSPIQTREILLSNILKNRANGANRTLIKSECFKYKQHVYVLGIV